jgi:hypothetical protein
VATKGQPLGQVVRAACLEGYGAVTGAQDALARGPAGAVAIRFELCAGVGVTHEAAAVAQCADDCGGEGDSVEVCCIHVRVLPGAWLVRPWHNSNIIDRVNPVNPILRQLQKKVWKRQADGLTTPFADRKKFHLRMLFDSIPSPAPCLPGNEGALRAL